jgi:hypothetical protein
MINRFFQAPSTGEPFIIFRIGIALVALVQSGWLAGSVLFSVNSTPETYICILLSVYLFSLGTLLTGTLIRYAAFVALALHLIFMNTGWYEMELSMPIALCYCIVLPLKKERKWNTLFIRILQFHLCLIYVMMGVEKVMAGSLLFPEICYPLFIWWRRTGLYAYLVILVLHLGEAVFMRGQLLPFVMIISNTAAFGWPYIQRTYRTIIVPRAEQSRLKRAGRLATQAFWNEGKVNN